MEAERWKRIEDLYHAALAEPPEKRTQLIQQACPSDPGLCAEVESLLKGAQDDSSFLESSVVAPGVPGLGPAQAVEQEETAGTLIGRYHLLQKAGEGGMGEVWLAEQKEPVRRRVALKLVKAGMNTREVMARFESERQALALMDHPAIAKVFDAGSTPQGAPYFVMEYVAGVPITAYCGNRRLSTRERLELFVRVCEGVQHAHQKAIIHRDLKPSNILVAEVDGRAVPKIIDFGVAKALTQKLTADTILTRMGALVGTPEYMSPEQANSSGKDIDTRTDVYSLGIILYELLAGVPPIELRKVAFDEFLRRLREEEPPKPSTKIRTQDAATSTEIARQRRTEPLTLVKQVRGDLDSIALKALEKDRSRRYGSPSEFAADIGRYLNNEAVLAMPPSAVYRARKFAGRHRGALATSAAFAVVLILAAGVSIWQSIRATRQRDRADREAAVSQAVNEFLQNDLLAQASASNQLRPGSKADPDLKVRTALDRAAARISGKFGGQPEVEAAMRNTLGQTYIELGLGAEARTQLQRALDLYRRVLGAENPKTLKTMSSLGPAFDLEGKNSEAEAIESQALQIQRRVLGREHPDTLHSMDNLASTFIHQGNGAQAEKLESQTLEIRRRVLGPEHPDTLASMYNLAFAYQQLEKSGPAEALLRQTLELQRRVLGPEHPDTLESMNDLAYLYEGQGKLAEAEALARETLAARRRTLGSDHPDTAGSMMYLGRILNTQGKYAQAEPLFTENLQVCRRALGPENPQTLSAMHWLAAVYARQGKYAQAEALYKQTLAIRRRVETPDSFGILIELGGSVYMYQRWGKYALAESAAAEALAVWRRENGSDDRSTISAAFDLALACQSQGKFTKSETLAREALTFYQKKSPDRWERFRAESLLGASLAGQKKYAEAEPLLLEGYRGMNDRKDKKAAWQDYYMDLAHKWLVQLYAAWGKPEKAAEWKNK